MLLAHERARIPRGLRAAELWAGEVEASESLKLPTTLMLAAYREAARAVAQARPAPAPTGACQSPQPEATPEPPGPPQALLPPTSGATLLSLQPHTGYPESTSGSDFG
eukprot:3941129-Rhodomonas_salina.6